MSAGAGLLAVPRLIVDTVRREDVCFVRLDVTGLRMVYGLAWLPQRLTPDLMALVHTVQEIVRPR